MPDQRREIAVHEAGHVVAAIAVGVGARAWLAKCPFDDEAAPDDDLCCLGMANFCECSAEQARVIAFGGVAAEGLALNPSADAGWIVEQIRSAALEPSEEDWAFAGLTPEEFRLRPDRESVERAVAALRCHPSLFEACAYALVEAGSLCLADPLVAIRSQAVIRTEQSIPVPAARDPH